MLFGKVVLNASAGEVQDVHKLGSLAFSPCAGIVPCPATAWGEPEAEPGTACLAASELYCFPISLHRHQEPENIGRYCAVNFLRRLVRLRWW